MQGEGAGTSLKQLIQGMAGDGLQLIQGVVESTEPLKIKATNDDKLTVGPGNVIVPWQLTDFKTEVTVDWLTENRSGGSSAAAFASHNHAIQGRKKIIVHNALRKGDTVHLLALNHGKLYFVLDRTGGSSTWQA